MSASKVLFFLCISFVAGISLESLISSPAGPASGGKIPQHVLLGFLFMGILLILGGLFARGKKFAPMAVLGFCLLFFILGILRMQMSDFITSQDKLAKLNDSEEEIVLKGVIIGEPDVRENSQKIKVKVENSTILVTTGRYPEYNYADQVKIIGRLETPMETEEFSYKNYLFKDNIYSVMGFPKIELLPEKSNGFFSGFYGIILGIKQKMRKGLQIFFPPKAGGIISGIVLGDRGAISKELNEKIKIAGLSHIIAVSGTHIAIVGSIIMAFLLYLGLWRKHAFYLAAAFIVLYVLLVGAPASAVRAGVMGIIYLAAQALGRQASGVRALVLAAALMLLFKPLYLIYDIGFQLSFLAVLGLISFEPILRSLIKISAKRFFSIKIPEKADSAIMLFSVTLAAQIFTLPLVIYNFGSISFVSLLTNLLVLPVVYLLMVFGFLAALAGLIFTGLGWIIALPAYFLTEYFVFIADVFSKPWAHKTVEGVSFVWPVIFYIFLAVVVRGLNHLRFRISDF